MNEDEGGDAFRGIPKIRLLVVLVFYLGVPWALMLLEATSVFPQRGRDDAAQQR